MATSTLVTIMDSGTTGDGDSLAVTVGPGNKNRGGRAGNLYDLTFSAQYTSGSGTLTPYLCNDPDSSPRVWTAISKLQDDGTDAAVTRTADFNMVMALPAQSLVKWTLSSSSSPVINMTVRGVLR